MKGDTMLLGYRDDKVGTEPQIVKTLKEDHMHSKKPHKFSPGNALAIQDLNRNSAYSKPLAG